MLLIEQARRWIKTVTGNFPKHCDRCEVASTCTFAYPERLILGQYVHIGPKSFIECKGGVMIGDGSILSARVTILSSTHDYKSDESVPYGRTDLLRQVELGKAVWVGYGALILPGVSIGDGGVVGAGAVVTRAVDSGQVVAGNPARVIGTRRDDAWRALVEDQAYRLRIRGLRG